MPDTPLTRMENALDRVNTAADAYDRNNFWVRRGPTATDPIPPAIEALLSPTTGLQVLNGTNGPSLSAILIGLNRPSTQLNKPLNDTYMGRVLEAERPRVLAAQGLLEFIRTEPVDQGGLGGRRPAVAVQPGMVPAQPAVNPAPLRPAPVQPVGQNGQDPKPKVAFQLLAEAAHQRVLAGEAGAAGAILNYAITQARLQGQNDIQARLLEYRKEVAVAWVSSLPRTAAQQTQLRNLQNAAAGAPQFERVLPRLPADNQWPGPAVPQPAAPRSMAEPTREGEAVVSADQPAQPDFAALAAAAAALPVDRGQTGLPEAARSEQPQRGTPALAV